MGKRNQTGEWAKQGRDLWTHPKVRRMASILGGQWQLELPLSGADKTGQVRTTVLIHTVVGGLSWLFLTINRHASEAGDGSMDAVLSDMTADNYFDDVTGLPGLQAAMIAVGWAVHDKNAATITLPNYLEHNTLAKGEKRAGRKGDSESPDAKRKRAARGKAKREKQKAEAGQLPDNSELSAPDNCRTSEDNAAEKSRAEVLKTHLEKKDLSGGQEPPPAEAAPAPQPMDALKRRVDQLRPDSWGKVRHWSAEEEQMLAESHAGLLNLAERDWLLLGWYFSWAAKPANADRWPDETRVTSKRRVLLAELSSYLERAGKMHRAAGRPPLTLAEKAAKLTPSGDGAADAGSEKPVMSFREQALAK